MSALPFQHHTLPTQSWPMQAQLLPPDLQVWNWQPSSHKLLSLTAAQLSMPFYANALMMPVNVLGRITFWGRALFHSECSSLDQNMLHQNELQFVHHKVQLELWYFLAHFAENMTDCRLSPAYQA